MHRNTLSIGDICPISCFLYKDAKIQLLRVYINEAASVALEPTVSSILCIYTHSNQPRGLTDAGTYRFGESVEAFANIVTALMIVLL